MNVNIKEDNGYKQIIVDIRPYCFGLPKETKHRRPAIAYQKEFEEIFDNEDRAEKNNILKRYLFDADIDDKDSPMS